MLLDGVIISETGEKMIFEGSIQQLKFYLKHLKRDRGIIARRIEEIGPGQYRIDIQGVDTMKEVQKNTLEKIRIQRTNFNSLANEVIKGIAEESKKL